MDSGHLCDRVDGIRRRGLMGAFCCALVLGTALGSAASPTPSPSPGATPPPQNIASVDGGVEAAIDAPWRLEPDASAPVRYPVLPIVVSIHDVSLQNDPETQASLGVFCEMAIREGDYVGPDAPTEYRLASSLDEVERSDAWPSDTDPARNHSLCRHWAGETCSGYQLDVGVSAEWHGTVLYRPKEQRPGKDVHLTIQVRVARAGQPCGPPQPLLDGAPFDRLERYPQGAPSYVMTNRLSVHLGEEAWPRFDDGWVYGDLHYHSQGTDNEGESAHAYRPTLQAMRAMGLDFLFATEHASDSEQILDVDPIIVDNVDLDSPSWILDAPVAVLEGLLEAAVDKEKIEIGAQLSGLFAARDMNEQRFAVLLDWLNKAGVGANAEVMRAPGRAGAPRIFLGGEVDVIPEMSDSERSIGHIRYGNGAAYDWTSPCTAVPDELNQLELWTSAEVCGPDPRILGSEETFEGRRFKIHDVQGLGEIGHYARQHMVHLPVDGTRGDAFVSSETGTFGGAKRRLGPARSFSNYPPEATQSVLFHDYAMGKKGYAFLAHPADAASGSGIGRLGPDIVPYSDVQLRTAFESPWVLGLELWNEDPRLYSTTPWGFPMQVKAPEPLPGGNQTPSPWIWGSWLGPSPRGAYAELHHGLAAWDKMLLWGIRSKQTAGLEDTEGWPLPPGEPRRVFMAGGSDAHGDLNYRRQGRMTGVSGVTDSAIGKPRNLVNVGLHRPETVTGASGETYGAVGQKQVTDALASGNFAITDGPALRIALDANANGVIDSFDVPMGGVSKTPSRGTYVPFVVEWKSTDEFGPLASIDLYVGVAHDDTDRGLVYAPADHGVHSAFTKSGAVAPHPYVDSAAVSHPELVDGYMLDPTGRLRVTPTAAEAKAGRKVVYLRANDFLVGQRRVVPAVPAQCTPNYTWCNKPGSSSDEECEWECTEPTPSSYVFDSASLPDRMYVRAFARTVRKAGALCTQSDPAAVVAQKSGQCIERLAFTNPIWVDNTVAPDFSISCTPASLAISNHNIATSNCTVTSIGGFSQPVALGCSTLPNGTACRFSSTTVTPPANGSIDTSLAVVVGSTVPGPYSFKATARPTTGPGHDASIALTVKAGPAMAAAFDATLKAPSCGRQFGRSCDSGATLLLSRAPGGSEPNTPNTIGGSCLDGTTGPASGRWTGNDRIKVSTLDGANLAANRMVRIDATVFASSPPDGEAADFFYAANAANPTWTLIGTVVPTLAGAQTLSASYRLPASASEMQAVRVQFRLKTSTAPCAASGLNDRDDLIFLVGLAP
jgi:hypothetical protein